MTAPLLVVQHEDDCPPALVGDWLRAAGLDLDVRRPYAGDALPAVGELGASSGLLVLGGPMGAEDDARHAWLAPTKALVREAVRTGLPTLGICLGHQLIGAALGGTVAVNPRGQQLGLLDVGWTTEAARDELVGPLTPALPRRGIHWNDDLLVGLPVGAVVLAQTTHHEPQVVRFGPRTWGVQLHPEADLDVVRAWAASDAGSHQARGIDQAALLAAIDGARAELDEDWRPVAERFAEIVRGGAAADTGERG